MTHPTPEQIAEIKRRHESPHEYVGVSNDELRRLFVKTDDDRGKLLAALQAAEERAKVAEDELAEIYKDMDDAASTVQEVLLRLRIHAARPDMREMLKQDIASGVFDGVGD